MENSKEGGLIGFSCAYTPVSLISAAGFTPYRILPQTTCAEQAGGILHDNICSHVKRILDRFLSKDLPELTGIVFMNTCDSMRRLADAIKTLRQDDKAMLFAKEEFLNLAKTLGRWSGSHTSFNSGRRLYYGFYRTI